MGGRRKYHWLIWLAVGLPILIIILVVGTLAGSQSSCDDSSSNIKSETNMNSKDMTTNAKNIYQHWQKEYHATPQGAAGVLGALQLESRLDPKSVNSSSGATGLCQWLGNRLVALDQLAKSEGKDPTNLGAQLDYLDQELHGSYKQYQSILRLNNVHEATKQWTLGFEGLKNNPDQWYLQQRQSYADHWYSVIGTSDPASKDAMANASNGEEITLGCDNDPSFDGGNDIVKTAEHFKGWFYYNQTHPSKDLGNLNNPNKNGGTDCSGFVWLVLNKAGYKVPPDMGWYTATMASDANGAHKWLQAIPSSQAKAGDIVIVNQGNGGGSNGHTAILLETWHGNSTKVIEEGGRTNRSSVNEDEFGTSFTDLLNDGNVVFAQPIKK